ncbi:hypothetical protein [Streptomyces sp. RFCAC02]|uniref:hypothetical protein n=1 Tax=Streptomyces sp. RFCAC02 TaxID=2499143 RepID=UPI00102244BA|nr:hypothetical protein [Streptomyces sp. RFCAC02]
MTPMSRRAAVRGAATFAGASALAAHAAPARASAEEDSGRAGGDDGPGAGAVDGRGATGWTEAELRDRRRVLALGFTAAEADCWLLVARAGAAFFALPEVHPSETPDVVDAVHVVQRILMQRPAYRRYREMGEAEEPPPAD